VNGCRVLKPFLVTPKPVSRGATPVVGPAAKRSRASNPRRGGPSGESGVHGGRNAPWPMGSTGSADSSLGRPERVWVSGQERPDWRVSGANTLTSDQPAKRLHGARCWPANRAAPCAGGDATGNARAGSPCQDGAGDRRNFISFVLHAHILRSSLAPGSPKPELCCGGERKHRLRAPAPG
jgi:hypothetical protein